MENTHANKIKFLSQYLYSVIVIDGIQSALTTHNLYQIWMDDETDCFLELKPLSNISDEDAKTLMLDLGTVVGLDRLIKENSTSLVKDVIGNYMKVNSLWMLPSRFTDKARELGYLIDWNGLSTETLIEYGWAKLAK